MHLVKQFSLFRQASHFLWTFVASAAQGFMMIRKTVIQHHIVISHFHQTKSQIHIIIGHPQCLTESTRLPEYLCPYQQTGTRHCHAIQIKAISAKIIRLIVFHELELMHRSHWQIDNTVVLYFHRIRIIQL